MIAGGEPLSEATPCRLVEWWQPPGRASPNGWPAWQPLPPMRRARSAAGLVWWPPFGLVTVGGRGEEGEPLTSAECFDGSAWHEIAPLW